MPNLTGAPQPSQIITYTDARSKVFELAALAMGIGQAGSPWNETGTIALQEQAAKAAILGDGTAANPGLGNSLWQQLVSDPINSAGMGIRFDSYYSKQSKLMRVLDDLTNANIPGVWSFTGLKPVDALLSRMNGAAAAPTTPAAVGVLTAVANTNGALPVTTSGLGPRLLHTLVGASDYNESLPTAEAAQVAITGIFNAYSYQIAGVVPVGIKKVRLYRGLFGGLLYGPYYWDQDIPVTEGAAYPAILLLQPDALLRTDFGPPVWMQCCLRPGAACLYALAFSVPGTGGAATGPMLFQALSTISPGNVLLGPANGFIGLGNQQQTAILGSSVITAATVTTYTPGAIQTASNPARAVQGFGGAMGLRARCTTGFAGTALPTIDYTYFDAAHGWGNIQTATLAATAGFAAPAAGATIAFALPAGRVLQSILSETLAGTAVNGAYLYEAVFPRA